MRDELGTAHGTNFAQKEIQSPKNALKIRFFGVGFVVLGVVVAYFNVFLLRFDWFVNLMKLENKGGSNELTNFIVIGVPVGALMILHGVFTIFAREENSDNLIDWVFSPQPSKSKKVFGVHYCRSLYWS